MKAQWARQRNGNPELGEFHEINQDNVYQQDKDSRYWVEDRIFQARKTKHSKLHDRVQSISHKDIY